MDVGFVSEVDRKFFANNMLSNEDWEASMELSEIMGIESPLPEVDMINDFPTEFQYTMQLPTDNLSSFFPTTTHDDLLNDWSDSSDSGVSGMVGIQSPADTIKSEPLSPTPSSHSDSGDSGISQITEQFPVIYTQPEIVNPESLPYTCMSSNPQSPIDLTTTISEIKQEAPILQEAFSPSLAYTSISVAEEPNIHSILNSKVKIQPKPDHQVDVPSSPQKTISVSQGNGSQKPLVLTPEEFQRLTNQGVLRFQPPKQESVLKPQVLTTTVTLPVSAQPAVVPMLTSNTTVYEDKDSKTVKRQQRMIKNRESASLSRKRKKEYMSSIEERLHKCSAENEKLRQENLSLKRKLTQLHNENETLKQRHIVPPAVKKTCILAVFVMLSLNLGSWSGIVLTGRSEFSEKLDVPVVHKGRQLFSILDNDMLRREDTVDKLHNIILEYGGTPGNKKNLSDILPMCPTYFNKTESMRLAEQLAGWMYRHEEKKKKVDKKNLRRQKDKQLRPISTLRKAMRGDLNVVGRKHVRSMEANYQIQVYGGADSGRDFLKGINRRNDTFYVLSFNEDYYLVPAVHHNKTTRPRMSLVMPAVALNESMMPPEGQVGMMQIDCEVMNTKLIHVQKSAIPKPVRDRQNSTYSKFDEGNAYYP